jgi:hypothetical protein
MADNRMDDCNVLVPGHWLGAMQGRGFYPEGAVLFTEWIGNVLSNSDGISVVGLSTPIKLPPPQLHERVKWVRWAVLRRNNISGVSQAALAIVKNHSLGPPGYDTTKPQCGSVQARGDGQMICMSQPNCNNISDLVVERNHVECPAGAILPAPGGQVVTGCQHCDVNHFTGALKMDDCL